MLLEEILVNDNVVSLINENIREILLEVPELRFVISYKKKDSDSDLDLWNKTLLSLYYSYNDLSIRMALLLKNLKVVLAHKKNIDGITAVYYILKRNGYDKEFIDEVIFLVKNIDNEIDDFIIENDFCLAEKLYKAQRACFVGVNDNKNYLKSVKYKIKKRENSFVY